MIFIELLFFTAIALFFFNKLYNSLGSNPQEHQTKKGRTIDIPDAEVIIENPNSNTVLYNGFKVESFLKGAKNAYYILNRALCEKDYPTLQKGFDSILLEKVKKSADHISVQSINDAAIESMYLKSNYATIDVSFTASGKKVNSVDQNTMHREQWTFARNITSSSPNWIVVDRRTIQ